nr:MAG TPA: hypothetical protein [Caudoviricetes sp.]
MHCCHSESKLYIYHQPHLNLLHNQNFQAI